MAHSTSRDVDVKINGTSLAGSVNQYALAKDLGIVDDSGLGDTDRTGVPVLEGGTLPLNGMLNSTTEALIVPMLEGTTQTLTVEVYDGYNWRVGVALPANITLTGNVAELGMWSMDLQFTGVLSNGWQKYVSGGLAAYDAQSAASYAASKINLLNPGTYNAIAYGEVAEPTWTAGTGWVFDGTTRRGLTTGITPALLDQSWSIFATFSGAASVVRRPMLSTGSTFPPRYLDLWPRFESDVKLYGSGNKSVEVATAATSGCMAITGRKCWYNGLHVATIDATTDTFNPGNAILIGTVGFDVDTMIGNIKRVWIADRVVSDEEAVNLYNVMTNS